MEGYVQSTGVSHGLTLASFRLIECDKRSTEWSDLCLRTRRYRYHVLLPRNAGVD